MHDTTRWICRHARGARAAILALAATMAGCVLGPYDGAGYQDHTQPIPFSGYASEAGATLNIQCRRPGTTTWRMAGSTTAGAGVANPGQDTPLYFFNHSLVVRSDCWLDQGEFGWHTQLRILEPGGSVGTLYTFDLDGLNCLSDELGEDEEWAAAGAVCQSGNTLTIWTIH